jgi:hypothetical protein
MSVLHARLRDNQVIYYIIMQVMGQIEKFRGSSINGDSEHFTVLKEDE